MTIYAGHNDPRGRTPVDPDIFKQPGTHIIPTSGQSMLGNWSSVSHYNTGQPSKEVYELNINDGLIYKMDGWQVANCDGAPGRLSILPAFGDYLNYYGKSQRVLWVPLNIGDTGAARWAPTGDLFPRIERAVSLLQGMGLDPTYWLHMLGQRDAEDGMSATNFANLTIWMIQGMRGLGMNAHVLIGHGAYKIYIPQANIDAIRQGQLAAALATGNSLGADDDLIPNIDGVTRVDGVHWAEQGRHDSITGWLPAIGAAP